MKFIFILPLTGRQGKTGKGLVAYPGIAPALLGWRLKFPIGSVNPLNVIPVEKHPGQFQG